ncbi:hypothetical protein HY636_02860 [Candidatus Woesearchaeota archaeon]|nr:hypothetical protein [Candidatus Woesearchaeota archaeon]
MAADGQIPLEFALCDIPYGATPVASAPLLLFFAYTLFFQNMRIFG